MLTSYADERLAMEAVDAGASGFLLKDASARRRLGDPRRAPRRGGAPPGRRREALAERRRRLRHADLTPRELEVLRLIARGLQNKGIAAELHLSEKTVKTHVSAVS
jgi:DNA-binding NarL/FixJ family response regulator